MVPFILLYKLSDIYCTMKKLFDKVVTDIQTSKQKRKETGSSKKRKNKNTTTSTQTATQNQTATGQQSNSSNITTNTVESQRLLTGVVFENAIHTTPEIFDSINKYRGVLNRAISVGQGPPGKTSKTIPKKDSKGNIIKDKKVPINGATE